MTVLSQTQMALRQVMKERDNAQTHLIQQVSRNSGLEYYKDCETKRADKWESMYKSLAELLENAARYCAMLPPKTLNQPSFKEPHREYEVASKLLPFESDSNNRIFEFHRQRLHWVQSAIWDDKFRNMVHYRLRFDDGKALAYQYSKEGLRIQPKEVLIKEIAYQFANLWHKEIHDAR